MFDSRTTTELFYQFGLALLIGALIGLQREHAYTGVGELFAGVRTYAIVGLIGCAGGLAGITLQAPIIFAALIAVVGGLLIAAYIVGSSQEGLGLTSEMALIATLFCGGLIAWGYGTLATAVGVATAGLLALKSRLHDFAHRLSTQDMQAALTLAAISAIILPILPGTSVAPTPFDVINPQKIWFLVVLISTFNFSGYALHKIIGATRGIALTGIIGGIVSSTAVTLSNTQRSHSEPALSRAYALAILLAWSVMFLRVAILTGAIAPNVLPFLWPIIAIGGSACLIGSLWLVKQAQGNDSSSLTLSNPLELRSAIGFSLLYAAILIGANLARTWFGDAGIYLSSIFGGLVDVDAITLSLSELATVRDGIGEQTAARAIGTAVLTNTLVKGGIVLGGGSSLLRKTIAPIFTLMTCAMLVGLLWPW
jgi:uncharacterized membrane protein (DUF4010 family)